MEIDLITRSHGGPISTVASTDGSMSVMSMVLLASYSHICVLAATTVGLNGNAALEDISVQLPTVHEADGSLRHGLLSERNPSPTHTVPCGRGEREEDLFNGAALSKDLPHVLLGDVP